MLAPQESRTYNFSKYQLSSIISTATRLKKGKEKRIGMIFSSDPHVNDYFLLHSWINLKKELHVELPCIYVPTKVSVWAKDARKG